MRKYVVHITEIVEKDVIVVADDPLAAEDKVAELCNADKIQMLDDDCFDFERKIRCLGPEKYHRCVSVRCNDEWEAYLEYLSDWAYSKADFKHYGESPASFDEWCDNEYMEDEEDA